MTTTHSKAVLSYFERIVRYAMYLRSHSEFFNSQRFNNQMEQWHEAMKINLGGGYMQGTHSDYLVRFLDPATPRGAQVRLGLIYKSACGGGGSTY